MSAAAEFYGVRPFNLYRALMAFGGTGFLLGSPILISISALFAARVIGNGGLFYLGSVGTIIAGVGSGITGVGLLFKSKTLGG
jgi:hypothetical protein